MENKDRFGKILLLTLIIILGFVAYKRTESHPSATVSVDQKTKAEALLGKEDVEKIVKEYIMNNPSIIIESIEKMHKKKMDEMNAKTSEMLKSKKQMLENDKNSPTSGNGPVNIVMIYDYACSYCKKASLIVDKLLSENDQVRIIYKPYPILGDASDYMTKVAMSVYKLYPNKFREIHNAMVARKIASREDVVKILEESGLSSITIEAEFENSDIKSSLANLTELAHSLKIQGVPVFIINDNLYPGLLDLNRLNSIIDPLLPKKEDDDDFELPGTSFKNSEEKVENNTKNQEEKTSNDTSKPSINSEKEGGAVKKIPSEKNIDEKKPQIAPIGAPSIDEKKPDSNSINEDKVETAPSSPQNTNSTIDNSEANSKKLLKEQKTIKDIPAVK